MFHVVLLALTKRLSSGRLVCVISDEGVSARGSLRRVRIRVRIRVRVRFRVRVRVRIRGRGRVRLKPTLVCAASGASHPPRPAPRGKPARRAPGVVE
mgnify:FL=1